MLISRSLLLGRGEWSPQLRQSQRSKEPVLRFMGHAMAVFNLRSLKSFEEHLDGQDLPLLRRQILPWHRRSSYEPDAPARGVPQSPRWRVGLVCARMRNFLAGVILGRTRNMNSCRS